MKKFEVIKKIETTIDFQFEYGNKEKIYRYLFQYDKNRIIESMVIIHYMDDTPLDLTVEISNMYNCVVGCRFCASASLPESTLSLSPEDYLRQVYTALEESNINYQDYPKFYVAFTGIGEPSIVKEKIAMGIFLIKEKYPNVEVNIATTGFDNTCFKYWDQLSLPIRYFQLPFYSHDKEKTKFIIQNAPEDYDLKNNIQEAIKYKHSHKDSRIKINFVVIEGINDSEDDISKMIKYLQEYKDDIIIKVSYLNYTKKCRENNLYSPPKERMKEILKRLQAAGFSCYIFGTPNNTELGCGQLLQNYICDNESINQISKIKQKTIS